MWGSLENNLAKKLSIFLIALGLAVSLNAKAKTWKASLAQMPVYAESMEKGVLVDLVKAIKKASGQDITYQVVPFARSMNSVETSEVDFHMPLIEPLDMKVAKFSLSTETIFHVNFILYTKKGSDITPGNLDGKNIETDLAHTPYFPFKINASTSIESSLKKLDAGRIDGFIFADQATDPVLKNLKLVNVKRQLYKRFNVKIILPKAGAAETDKFLSETIQKLRKDGEYDKIMSVLDMPYDNWQM